MRLTCTGTLYMCLGQEDAADLRAPLRASEANDAPLRRHRRRDRAQAQGPRLHHRPPPPAPCPGPPYERDRRLSSFRCHCGNGTAVWIASPSARNDGPSSLRGAQRRSNPETALQSGLLRLRLAMTVPSLRGAQATKQSSNRTAVWIASPSARNDGPSSLRGAQATEQSSNRTAVWIASPSARNDGVGSERRGRPAQCATSAGMTRQNLVSLV